MFLATSEAPVGGLTPCVVGRVGCWGEGHITIGISITRHHGDPIAAASHHLVFGQGISQ